MLLSCSATHILLSSPYDRPAIWASSHYFDLGLRKCTAMLSENVNSDNARQLFISSILIALHTLLSRRDIDMKSGYVVPSAWFRALRGVKAVVDAAGVWLQRSDMGPMVPKEREVEEVKSILQSPSRIKTEDGIEEDEDEDESDEDEVEDEKEEGDSDADEAEEGGEAEESSPFPALYAALSPNSPPTPKTVYTVPMDLLSTVYTLLLPPRPPTHILRRKLLGFPASLSPEFLTLLDSHDAGTLVVVSYFFGLLALVDDVWWLQGAPEAELQGLLTVVPQEWQWAMEWPMKQIASRIPMPIDD
ncbi:MAG: hypothetical protein M1819_003947 [Sarea resinae]|nr:MAG: hypothetical protein M1819_003947 [Sarea resinae]